MSLPIIPELVASKGTRFEIRTQNISYGPMSTATPGEWGYMLANDNAPTTGGYLVRKIEFVQTSGTTEAGQIRLRHNNEGAGGADSVQIDWVGTIPASITYDADDPLRITFIPDPEYPIVIAPSPNEVDLGQSLGVQITGDDNNGLFQPLIYGGHLG